MFEEVTASNLVRVDLAGNKTLPSPHEINPACARWIVSTPDIATDIAKSYKPWLPGRTFE